jgi:hypothetical protein
MNPPDIIERSVEPRRQFDGDFAFAQVAWLGGFRIRHG